MVESLNRFHLRSLSYGGQVALLVLRAAAAGAGDDGRHNNDLKAAQKLGLKTAFVARPTEYGPHQKYDFEAKGDRDIVAKDFGGIADGPGCSGLPPEQL